MLAARVSEPALPGAVAEHGDMFDVRRRIDLEHGVDSAHAVFAGADRQVVPGAEVLDVHPRRPAAGIDAGLAGGLQRAGGDGEFLPGLRRLVGVEAGLPEGIPVENN